MNNEINSIKPHIVHSHDVHLDTDYTQWLVELKERYRSAQIKAAVKVNAEKLLFNWQLGRDLVQKKAEERWGSGVVEQVSLDLRNEFPNEKGFSARNLWYMKQWYEFYSTSEASIKLHQFGAELLLSDKVKQYGVKKTTIEADEKLHQDGAVFPFALAFIPWRHHVEIISKCKDIDASLFYMRNVIQNGWSRQTLLNCLHTDIYQNRGKAITNFDGILKPAHAELANEIIKENYELSFVSVNHNEYSERELEDALEQNITRFLLELGNGFAFIGRQKEVLISGTDRRVDLLFYHIRLRCYVVVELKARPFMPEFAGKLNFYVNAVDRFVKLPEDNPTLGLLVCTQFDQTEVELSFEGVTTPLGVATYNGIKVSDVLPSEELLRQRVKQLEHELRLSKKLIHKMTEDD